MKFIAYAEGPRWAKLRQAITEASALSGCTLEKIDSDKGIIKETVYYTLDGSQDQIEAFKRILGGEVSKHKGG